jgi:UDPglucose 6-dehydrogenase
VVIDGLLQRGVEVRVHDPEAMTTARRYFDGRVTWCAHNYDALDGANALLILTEWKPYRTPDFVRMKQLMAQPIIFDGRNLFDPKRMEELGFEYASVGRSSHRGRTAARSAA